MSNFLDLFNEGGSIQGLISDEVLSKAVSELAKTRAEVATGELVGMLDGFSADVTNLKVCARDAREQAECAEEAKANAERALAYLGETSNPLPLFRTVARVDDGKAWLRRNHVRDIPCVKDKTSAWYVPADWNPSTEA